MNIAEIIVVLQRAPVPHELNLVATPAEIAAAEARLGVQLPDSYRQFVREFADGGTLYGCQRINALAELAHLDADGDIPIYEGGSHPAAALIPFSPDAHGNAWVFLTRTRGHDGEYPVAYLAQGTLNRRHDHFYAWLQMLSIKRREIIRTLYSEEMLERVQSNS